MSQKKTRCRLWFHTVYRLYHSAGAGCDLRPWCEATVLVINVLDPAVQQHHGGRRKVIFDEATGGKPGWLIRLCVSAGALTSEDGAPVLYRDGQDYALDAQSGTITNPRERQHRCGTTVKAGYHYADPTKSHSGGHHWCAVNAAGNRTGMKLLSDSFNPVRLFRQNPDYCPGILYPEQCDG